MVEDGADILDIGGYSSRPHAEDISPEVEKNRVLPAINLIRKELQTQFFQLILSDLKLPGKL